ncbi:MAG: hypothetical protein RR744_09240 [Cellulosilyticaceae bacterium]
METNFETFTIAMIEQGGYLSDGAIVCPECEDMTYELDYDHDNECPICGFNPFE